MDLFMRTGADGTEAGAALDLAIVAHFLGQPEHVDHGMAEAERLATATGRIATLADLHAFRSMLCVQRGEWDQAAAERELWRSLLQGLGGRTVYGQLGELGEALQTLWQHGPERALPILKTEFPVRSEPLRALLAIERGDTETAQALLEVLQSLLPADGRGLVWLSIGLTVVSGLSSLEDPRGAQWAEALSRHRGGGFVWSLVDIELARIHTVAGDWDAAERLFEDAAQNTTERGMLPFYGTVLYEHALMLNRRRAPGDRSCASTLLTEAADIFDRLGLEYMRAKVTCILEARERGRPVSGGRSGLTPRETRVLELLAGGRSTKEIAAQLVVSEKTVSRHLEGIYGKLGVSNRLAAVAKAMRDRIVEPEQDE
jgi:ATP/maltotriose-dependent transcriptional regulator MalT